MRASLRSQPPWSTVLDPLYSSDEMRAAEQGHDVAELMERAGSAVAHAVLDRFAEARAITVVCGGGANGGDGRIAARVLEESGRDVTVVDAKPEDDTRDLGAPQLVVDALFGTGFSGAPREGAARLIEQMNEAGAPVVAVDLPSGVDASTGEVEGVAVQAAHTVTFHGPKVGLAVAPPRESLPVVEQRLLEVVKRPLEEASEAAEKASAVAIGPGLGRGDAQKALVRQLLEELELPVVVDADALYELEPVERSAATVMTPHAGELGRLLGEESSWVDAHRLEAARRCAERFDAVCVLKGPDSIVASPGEGALVCDLGTPALATAGTGDVLTGIVGAFLAKGIDARLAAAAATAAQQLSARFMDYQTGLVASDVIENLPATFETAEHWS